MTIAGKSEWWVPSRFDGGPDAVAVDIRCDADGKPILWVGPDGVVHPSDPKLRCDHEHDGLDQMIARLWRVWEKDKAHKKKSVRAAPRAKPSESACP